MVRPVDSNTSNYLNAVKGVIPRSFVRIKGRNRDTGAAEYVGFWNGPDSVDVSVSNPARAAETSPKACPSRRGR